jgi:hypothetical protein
MARLRSSPDQPNVHLICTKDQGVAQATGVIEPFLDCGGAAAVLGGVHPKTVEPGTGASQPTATSGDGDFVLLSWTCGCVLK